MATYYWVGGTGTWSGTGNTQFAATSGGVATLLNPTAADTVNFDANSGTAATVTVTATAVSLSTTVNKADINLSLSGSPTLCTAAGTLTFTTGTITLNTYTLSTGILSSNNSNTRAIAFGTGSISITGSNVNGIDFTTATGFTYTGTSSVNFTASPTTGTRRILFGSSGGATESNALNYTVQGGTDTFTLSGTNTSVRNINYTGFSGVFNCSGIFVYGNFTLSSTLTMTVTSTITFASTSGTKTINTNGITITTPYVFDGVGGTFQLTAAITTAAATNVTLTNGTLDLFDKTLTAGTFSSSNTNTRAILFGTGNITIIGSATVVWNMANTTNFSYTGTPTVNISKNSAAATTIVTGNTTEAQALNFNYTVGTYTLTDTNSVYKSLNFTGFTGTIPNSVRTIYGNLTLVSGMTLTAGSNTTTFGATSGTSTVTTAAKTLDFPITFNGIGGTFAFQDALTQGSTRAFTITNGTVQLKAGTTNTVGSFVTSGTNQKYLQSTTSGTQATLTKASGTTSVSYLTIKDSSVSGGIWNAYYINSNVDAGNNTLWDFNGYSAYGWFTAYGPDWLNKYGVIKGNVYGVIQDPYFVQ